MNGNDIIVIGIAGGTGSGKTTITKKLEEKVEYSFWEKYDDDHTVIRFATDWGTTEEETRALIDAL